MDWPTSPCPQYDDRIYLPAIPPPRSGGTEKKESQDHRRNPVCPQSGRPSLITYPGRRLPVAPNAVTASVKRQSNFCQSSARRPRSEEHTSELQSLMRISYAVFCLKKKTKKTYKHTQLQVSTICRKNTQVCIKTL